MKESSTFRLSFHVSHPKVPADEIENAFNLPTNFSHSVGWARMTRSGCLLGGTYKITSVGFRLHEPVLSFDTVDLVSYVQEQLETFDLDYLHQLTLSGGYFDFLVGVFSGSNVMFELPVELLSQLAALKISVKIDIYGE